MIVKNIYSLFKSFSTLKLSCAITSPQERMSLTNINTSLQLNNVTSRWINNIIMGKNCSLVALKYSKCYLCKLPPIKNTIRNVYNMGLMDQALQQVQNTLVNQIPERLKILRFTFPYFKYQNKNIRPAIGLIYTEQLSQLQNVVAKKFLSAIESVSAGFALHNMMGTTPKIGFVPSLALKILSKKIKDSYLVLGGDLFHIKGSVLASQTGICQLSKLTAEVEIDLCKYVYLKEKIEQKVKQNKYKDVTLNQIHELTKKKISPFLKSLKGMQLINSRVYNENHKPINNFQNLLPQQKDQIYEITGLLLTYRRELQDFMFNFPQIAKKYSQYIKDEIKFSNQDTLTYYLLYQGAKSQKRIDIAYLMTVQMMSNQIECLKKLLKEKLKNEQIYEDALRKINYTMMIYM